MNICSDPGVDAGTRTAIVPHYVDRATAWMRVSALGHDASNTWSEDDSSQVALCATGSTPADPRGE